MSRESSIPVSVLIISNRADDVLAQAVISAQPAAEIIILSHQTGLDWDGWQKRHQVQVKVVAAGAAVSDFAQARNQALHYATQPWVFFLDSDEVIEPESWLVIRDLVSKNQIEGAYIHRRDFFFGQQLRWGEVANVWLLRLAQRDKIVFHRPVHEWAEVKGATARVPVEINHYSHQSTGEFLQTVAAYAKREARFRHQQGQRFFWPELVAYPVGKWLLNVCGRLAFLDGWRGMTYALMMSLHSALVRIYLYDLETNKR